jgi:hypothetical protein
VGMGSAHKSSVPDQQAERTASRMSQTLNLPPGTVDVALEALFPSPSPYAEDPVGWVTDRLGGFLWSKQIEIMEALKEHRYVAVQSCHGPGKSFSASAAVSWWLDVHDLGSAFVVTTAPSWPQVQAILWREIRRRWREGKLRGRITQDCHWHMGEADTRAGDSSEELIAMGRKPQDYDETTFQGIHARYFLAVLDEAGGIPEQLWNSVLSLATNENARILAIGNPDDPNSHFAKICKPGSGWHVIKISAFDTPNFTGEYVPEILRQDLVSQIWVADRTRDWGVGSPLYVSKILGEWPDISDEYLISPSLLERAHALDLPGHELGRYGLDVARMGTDKSVLYRNRGGQIRLVDAWAKKDTMQTAGRAAKQLASHGVFRVPCTVDIIGLGAGVFDRLRERRFNVGPHQGSARANNPAKFKNRRSEVWWTFREMMEDDLIDLDSEDEKLNGDLTNIKWAVDSAGRIFVETREDMKDRGVPSPDHGDAAVLSTVSAGAVPTREQAEGTISAGILTKRM